MAEPAIRRMSLAEFLRWEDGTDTRYELIGGVPVAMAPPAVAHGVLSAQLAGRIGAALRERRPCFVQTEAGIALSDHGDSFYVADLAVSCTPARPGEQLLPDPVLIVEILSPSTAAFDRQTKAPDYRHIPSVREILLIDSESAFAEVWRREGERWISEIVRGPQAALSLASIGLTVAMGELYEGIEFAEQNPNAAVTGRTSN